MTHFLFKPNHCRKCRLLLTSRNWTSGRISRGDLICRYCHANKQPILDELVDSQAFLDQWYNHNYTLLWYRQLRKKCVSNSIAFDLELTDFVIPSVCPVLGIKLEPNSNEFKDNSPSMDRIIPSKGYVKTNVVIISHKANRIKNDASLEELRKVTRWLEQLND